MYTLSVDEILEIHRAFEARIKWLTYVLEENSRNDWLDENLQKQVIEDLKEEIKQVDELATKYKKYYDDMFKNYNIHYFNEQVLEIKPIPNIK